MYYIDIEGLIITLSHNTEHNGQLIKKTSLKPIEKNKMVLMINSEKIINKCFFLPSVH